MGSGLGPGASQESLRKAFPVWRGEAGPVH